MRKIIVKIFSILVLGYLALPANAQSCIGEAGLVKWSYWKPLLPFYGATASMDELTAMEYYPSKPEYSAMLTSITAPQNYADMFVGSMRGFIKVPQTDNYIFNITGDEKAVFYLSTDQSVTNKVKRAELTVPSGITEYTKQPSQTSETIQLVGGQYYYFEMFNFEAGGTDHMTLYWKKASGGAWTKIDYNFIYEYACGTQNCPDRGTPCNDGNAQTTNDQQDGFCNCMGTPVTSNTCVGEKGLVQAYYYDNIVGYHVENDLINAPKFPLRPDRMEKLKGAYGPIQNPPYYAADNYGSLLQGYLTVPVSGNYEFNLTGDNQTIFNLSSDDKIENKEFRRAKVENGVIETNHTNEPLQNIGPLFLEKGKFYYYEIKMKENTDRDHFTLYWKTPFHEIKEWKRISNFYLYDYKCEVSCIAQGTPCNDDNPYTNNDKINATCECVGTPCSGPDCNDISVSYQTNASCSPTDNLTTLSEASWVSCGTLKPNPNSARTANKNWILYDFGSRYKFQDTRVWNYNVTGETNKGFKSVYVDYSIDGSTWQQLGGTYNWPQAPGNADYSGFTGPNFNDVKARYVLVSAINNWGDASCSGFSKITFNASLCENEGTACNDGDPLTINDKFDNSCNCRGVNINCASDTIKLDRSPLSNGEYKAIKNVAAQSLVQTTKDITFTAGNSIVLLPGFEVQTSAVFKADIANCVQQAFVANNAEKLSSATDDNSITEFSTDSTETEKLKQIIFRINKPGYVKLKLKDKGENTLVTMIDGYFENLGTQIKLFPTNKLPKGLYWVELDYSGKILKEQLEIKD